MRLRRHRKPDPEVAPEDIFLDASNSARFDRSRFEGRLERPLTYRTYTSLSMVLVAFVLVLGARAGYLQIVQGKTFAAQSAQNSLEATELFAPRGVVTDRNGVVLVQNKDREGGGTTREYVLPALGQIIGYVSRPKKDAQGNYYDTLQTGLAGLEAEYDELLSGENGRVLVERDVSGKVRSSGTIVPAREGTSLALALDESIERNLALAIARTASEKGFIAGAGAVMDIHTGEVLGLVSHPSYDPNIMSAGTPAETIEAYSVSEGHPFLDHAVQGIYAPGSIVKPFISAGVLTDGLVTKDTVINDPGFLTIPNPYKPGEVFRYNGWKALGPMTVESAIAWSSDIYFYTVGGGFGSQRGLGIERLAYWYRQFGFGVPTGIDLPEEASGLIPTPEWKEKALDEPWYLGDTYFTAIGQYSMQVTPIQAARATAAVANGGKLVTPTLRKREVFDPPVTYVKVPVTDESLVTVRSGMRQTVTSALAQQLNVPYVSVAGTTGTAETGPRNQYDNSWIVGFFPYEEPRYAFAVVLERGPAGSGSQAVNAMRLFLDLLRAEDSPYVGGDGLVQTTTHASRTD